MKICRTPGTEGTDSGDWVTNGDFCGACCRTDFSKATLSFATIKIIRFKAKFCNFIDREQGYSGLSKPVFTSTQQVLCVDSVMESSIADLRGRLSDETLSLTLAKGLSCSANFDA